MEFRLWRSMIDRCRPSASRFKDYGGRGISVCPRWRTSFATFFEDMGPRPDGVLPSGRAAFSIDRAKNDEGYSKDNCRWATLSTQATNKRPRVGRFAPALVATPTVCPTAAQSVWLDAIRAEQLAGRVPTLRVLMAHAGARSTTAATEMLERLEGLGLVQMVAARDYSRLAPAADDASATRVRETPATRRFRKIKSTLLASLEAARTAMRVA